MGAAPGMGSASDVLVTRLGDDPIHAGMPRAWLSPDMEVYFYARGPAEGVHVLAYARDSASPGWECCGRWNGQPPTATGAGLYFDLRACVAREMCNRRALR
jgi:hypothetical protein